eukprot:scaffold4652_cov122-Isochrysis_galbana.AAC.2
MLGEALLAPRAISRIVEPAEMLLRLVLPRLASADTVGDSRVVQPYLIAGLPHAERKVGIQLNAGLASAREGLVEAADEQVSLAPNEEGPDVDSRHKHEGGAGGGARPARGDAGPVTCGGGGRDAKRDGSARLDSPRHALCNLLEGHLRAATRVWAAGSGRPAGEAGSRHGPGGPGGCTRGSRARWARREGNHWDQSAPSAKLPTHSSNHRSPVSLGRAK